LFEEGFEDCSYGFRPGRGPKAALAKVKGHIAQGDRWVAEFDIEGFFDNLSHRRLLRHFGKVVSDPEVVGLVRRWLKAGVVTDGLSRSATGTPQGGVISPLLANVYLHRLDQEMRQAGFRFVRYADDFIVTANRCWKVLLADQLVRHVLDDIGLSLNEVKTGIRNLTRDEIDFLGFCSYAGRFLRPRKRALAAFKDRIRHLTRRKRGMSLRAIVTSLNPVIRGWGNYFVAGPRGRALRRPRQMDQDAAPQLRLGWPVHADAHQPLDDHRDPARQAGARRCRRSPTPSPVPSNGLGRG
jgi:RNA-directed DNA polymerase